MIIQGSLNIAATIFLIVSFLIILVYGASQWFNVRKGSQSLTKN